MKKLPPLSACVANKRAKTLHASAKPTLVTDAAAAATTPLLQPSTLEPFVTKFLKCSPSTSWHTRDCGTYHSNLPCCWQCEVCTWIWFHQKNAFIERGMMDSTQSAAALCRFWLGVAHKLLRGVVGPEHNIPEFQTLAVVAA